MGEPRNETHFVVGARCLLSRRTARIHLILMVECKVGAVLARLDRILGWIGRSLGCGFATRILEDKRLAG